MKIQLPTLSIMEAYKVSKIVLESTPEDWLEFSAGQNTKTNLARFKSNKYVSFIKQIAGYIYFFFKSVSFRSTVIEQNDVLFFASSKNQFSVLRPIYNVNSEFSSVFIVPNYWRSHFATEQTDICNTKTNILYMLPVFVLTITRFFFLLKMLLATDHKLVFLRLKSFLLVYYWLVSHQVVLRDVRPKIVILSNDHNPEARTMIELCKYFGIKTAYVPHAGVSERFHSLDFNYSFLDGQHALDIYKNCDTRRSPTSKVVSKRLCFLVGNLRKLSIDKAKSELCQKFGLAIKGTDNIEDVVNIIRKLASFAPVLVRPHPSLKIFKYSQIIKKLSLKDVEFSDPKTQPVSEFLGEVTILISGNSTLLLEAASAGKNPVYLSDLSGGVHDYYGFVDKKITDYFESINDFVDCFADKNGSYKFAPDRSGINYYWSSFGKPYASQEAQIISNYLHQIVNGVLKLHSRYQITIRAM